MNNADGWRLHYTYWIGILILLGAFWLILQKLGEIPGDMIVNMVIGILGFVLGFVFNRESSVASARATERAIEQGAAGGIRANTLADEAKAAREDPPPEI